MKQKLVLVSVFVLVLAACTSTPQQTRTIATLTQTMAMPSATSTATVTKQATATGVLATASPIFQPILPSSTATFDVQTIATVTPASPAECPDVNNNLEPDLGFLDDWYDRRVESIQQFLNANGADALARVVASKWGRPEAYFAKTDLTGDGVPEIAIGTAIFNIFGCRGGEYEVMFELHSGYLNRPEIFEINDNNGNGIPEITLLVGVLSQGGRVYQVWEWKGLKFHSIIPSNDPRYPDGGEVWVEATGKIHYADIDHDLLKELVVDTGIPHKHKSTYVDSLPWRNERIIYEWNGRYFNPARSEFATPEFRFQAVQDADLAASQGEYDKALALYLDAIFSDQLKPFSPEIRRNLQEIWFAEHNSTPQPLPTAAAPDLTEYPRLAAYAYFRILNLHIIRGYESDAGTVHQTMQRKFPEGNPGHPYVEMATAFWNEYQITHNLTPACGAAIGYATDHPDILTPLSGDGYAAHEYVPADVCPFR